MWMSLLLVAFILVITYLQALQGLFSSLIMCTLTIVCCALAFAIHGYVANHLLIQWKPDFALPLALILAFLVPLVILRLIADSAIHRSCLVPALFDRVGGAAFGFVSGMTIVGVLAVCVQMLPFGESFLGQRRIDLEDPASEHGIWLSPDRFTVGLMSLLSGGIFSGDRAWSADHPDFVQEVGWSQTVPRGVRCYAPPGAIEVTATEDVTFVYEKKPGKEEGKDFEYVPIRGNKPFLAVRFAPSDAAADADRSHRYCPLQVSLIGRDQSGEDVQLHPIAVQDDRYPDRYVRSVLKDGKQRSVLGGLYAPNKDGQVGVLFEPPGKLSDAVLVYKMGARAPLPQPRKQEPRPEDEAPPPVTEAPVKTPPKPLDGRTHGANVSDAQFSDRLPHPVNKYSDVGGNVETREDALVNGHLMGNLDAQTAGGLTRLHVPEGKALLQISAQALRAGSILGHAKSFAVTSLQNYVVTDDSGGQYKICGQVAVAKLGDERVYEIQYYPEAVGSIGGVKKFSRIKESDLAKPDTELCFLFLIDRGRKVKTFSTTGSSGGQDISGLDLVAP